MVGGRIEKMRYASIDIGTNTILMLIGEIDESLSIRRIEDFYEVPRVGKSVSVTKRLDGDSIERGMRVLRRYRSIAEDYRVDRIVASATSAIRDAENRQEFIEPIKDDFGIDVEVIDGSTEAKLAFLGALSGVSETAEPALVIDIGGGSTELSYGTGMKPTYVLSLDIGAVRVTEKFFVHNPPNPDELREASEFIDNAFTNYSFSEIVPEQIFAVAGTATTLALIAQRKYEFDIAAVTNYEMSFDELRNVFEELRSKSPAEIRKLTKAAEGREDVLLAGALILLQILEAAKAKKFFATDHGLRYGYLIYKHMQFINR